MNIAWILTFHVQSLSLTFIYVIEFSYRLNRYCNYFWVRKINLSIISPSKRSRSIPNSVYVDMSRGDNVQGILGVIGSVWAKWRLG